MKTTLDPAVQAGRGDGARGHRRRALGPRRGRRQDRRRARLRELAGPRLRPRHHRPLPARLGVQDRHAPTPCSAGGKVTPTTLGRPAPRRSSSTAAPTRTSRASRWAPRTSPPTSPTRATPPSSSSRPSSATTTSPRRRDALGLTGWAKTLGVDERLRRQRPGQQRQDRQGVRRDRAGPQRRLAAGPGGARRQRRPRLGHRAGPGDRACARGRRPHAEAAGRQASSASCGPSWARSSADGHRAPSWRTPRAARCAARPGTAEFGSKNPPETHAWFVGYQGDVAFAVLVEKGKSGGSVAAPVAKDFLTALAAG